MPARAHATAVAGLALFRPRLSGWGLAAVVIAALVASPLVTVVLVAARPTAALWQHLVQTVLPGYLLTTLQLSGGVAVGVLLVGVSTAWLVTMCRFPGRRVFEWALLLPLAVPTYLAAFVYTDLLEYAGPVQGALRVAFGWESKQAYWFPEVRSLGGAITFMTLVLYPYVYMLSRAAFLEQSVSALEVGRSLGRGPWRCFLTVALPLARPAIVVGLLLAVMETLNDFGTVDFFAVRTLTVGIYRVWFGMNDAAGAAQMATMLLGLVLAFIALERWARRGQRFHQSQHRFRHLPGFRLGGAHAALAFTACALPVALGFGVPAAAMLRYAVRHYETMLARDYVGITLNSLSVSALAAGTAVAVGVVLAYGLRLRPTRLVRGATRLASVGYAVPGTVLAVGVLIPAAWLDNSVDAFMRATFGVSTGLLLSGTLVALTFAYVVRFLALSFGSVEASLSKVTPSMDDAARSLGVRPAGVLRRVHLPLIRGSMLTAAMLVFVDGMKELPMTLLLRPFNFETLATHVYQYASYEAFHETGLAALTIVAAGLLPVILLSRGITASRPGRGDAAATAAPDEAAAGYTQPYAD